VRLRLVVHDLVPDQDEAAEDEAADHAAHEALVRAAVLDTGQEAADDRDRRAHRVVEDLVPVEREAGEQPEHGRHRDAARHLEPEGTLEERRRQLNAGASLTEISSALPSISVRSSPPVPSNSSDVASVSPAT